MVFQNFCVSKKFIFHIELPSASFNDYSPVLASSNGKCNSKKKIIKQECDLPYASETLAVGNKKKRTKST